MNNQEKIEKNLGDFYMSFNDDIPSYENNFVKSISKNWPNFILIKDYKNDFIKITNSFKNNKKIAKYWIFDSKYVKKHQKQFKKEKLFPLKNWLGMYFKTTSLYTDLVLDDFKVEQLKLHEMDDFIRLINDAVFNKETLDTKLLASQFKKSNFHFFVGKHQDKIVSTCLIFNNGITNGLYFITTKQEFRGKGFGNAIIKKAINNQLINGEKEFVLHANKIGVSIYKKLGFKEFSKLSIFVKI